MTISMRQNRQVKHAALIFSHSAVFLIFTASGLAFGQVTGAEKDTDAPYSATHTVQVVSDEAEAFLGEKSQGKIPLGTIHEYTEERDGWLFVPRVNAWVRSDRVVPIERSEAHFTAVIEEKSNAEAFHHRGIARQALKETDKAIADLSEAIRLGLKTSAVFVNRGNSLQAKGDFRAAMDDYNRAIEIDPENALAYHNRALVWAAIGNLDRAIEDSTHAIRIDPRFAEAYNNRGVTYRKQGDFQRAIREYTEAIHHFASYGDAYANRGFARAQLGEYADALQDYYQAVTISPGSPQAFNDAAWLMATCPEEEFRNGERAVEYARYACELTKHQNGEYVDTLAAALAERGDFESAAKTQEQAITLLDEASRKAAEARLERYRDGKPFRVTP